MSRMTLEYCVNMTMIQQYYQIKCISFSSLSDIIHMTNYTLSKVYQRHSSASAKLYQYHDGAKEIGRVKAFK